MISHDGRFIPTLVQRWDPADKDWLWMAWDGVLNEASITASTWTLPSGWTAHETRMARAVVDEAGNSYAAANGVLTSNPDAAVGERVEIANKVVLSDGREYERSVAIVVDQQ